VKPPISPTRDVSAVTSAEAKVADTRAVEGPVLVRLEKKLLLQHRLAQASMALFRQSGASRPE
jgi:hypothetical protein